MRRNKNLARIVGLMLIVGTMFVLPVSMQFVSTPAYAYDGGGNESNEQQNYSGGVGAPNTDCTSPCDNSGNSKAWFNSTCYDDNGAKGGEDYTYGRGQPRNHTIWVHINNTGDTEWIRNFTGEAGHGANADFTVTRTETTGLGKMRFEYEWTIPVGFPAGNHKVNFNVTDNASSPASQIWDNSTSFTVVSAVQSIAVELRKADNTLEDISVGRWGNVTWSPDGTNVEFNVNFIRAENDGDFALQQFTVDWTPDQLSSATTGENVPIDANIEWSRAFTNSSGDCPDSNPGDWSDWSGWFTDTTGSYEFEFHVTGEYCWVRIRILDIATDDLLGEGDDYNGAYTVTTSGTG